MSLDTGLLRFIVTPEVAQRAASRCERGRAQFFNDDLTERLLGNGEPFFGAVGLPPLSTRVDRLPRVAGPMPRLGEGFCMVAVVGLPALSVREPSRSACPPALPLIAS